MGNYDRRSFIKTAGIGTAMIGLSGGLSAMDLSLTLKKKNKLPRWRGFNLLDFLHFQTNEVASPPAGICQQRMISNGCLTGALILFEYLFSIPAILISIRVQIKLKRSHRKRYVTFNEHVIAEIEKLVYLANKHNMHVSLNLHRVPGFCINSGFNEPYNLWKDEPAQQALYTHWEMWAKRFKNVSEKKISFDLINEPCFREDMNDQFSKKSAVPGELYRKIVQGCLEAIHKQNPNRLVVADGNNGGGLVTPELNDLKVGQSCRGYYPGVVSHYRASWVWKNPDDAPMPVWPGTIDGKYYDRKSLEEFYRPWTELVHQGVGVHCGECGCYRETPHDVLLPG